MFLKLTSASLLLLLPLTQASTPTPPTSYTILVPCGRAASNSHAIIPDASCQQISSSGAFVIASLGHLDKNVRLGFSTTPDCKATFTPTVEDLQQLQRNQTCRTFFTDAPNSGGAANSGGVGQESDGTPSKRDVHDEQPQPQDFRPEEARTQAGSPDSLVKRDIDSGTPAHFSANGMIQKRNHSDKKKRKHGDNKKRASTVAAQQQPPKDSTQAAMLLTGQVPLRYVMVVQA